MQTRSAGRPKGSLNKAALEGFTYQAVTIKKIFNPNAGGYISIILRADTGSIIYPLTNSDCNDVHRQFAITKLNRDRLVNALDDDYHIFCGLVLAFINSREGEYL